jgi:hypothetical protein
MLFCFPQAPPCLRLLTRWHSLRSFALPQGKGVLKG